MTESFVYGSPAAGAGDGEDQTGAVDDTVETVGDSDTQADAARTGADDAGGLDGPSFGQADTTDTDGETVGAADADADAIRSGVDPDDR